MEPLLKINYASDFVSIRCSSTARASLAYSVCLVKNKTEMKNALVSRIEAMSLAENGKCGIIYVQLVSECSIIQALLQTKFPQISTTIYHAQLPSAEKVANQAAFMNPLVGTSAVCMVATSAFAVGIDKPNIQYIFNYGMPDSLLDYAQASGRSARDPHQVDGPADCVLFSCPDEMKDLIQWRLKSAKASEGARKQEELKKMEDYIKVMFL